MVKIIWSESARLDLAEIKNYIARDSKKYALKTCQEIVKLTRTLEKFPLLGRMVPEFSNPQIREIIFKNYRIIYRHSPSIIEIAALIHSSRNLNTV